MLTRGFRSTSANTRTAAPKIVSPSRKGLRNSVLSPYKRRSDRSVTCSCAPALDAKGIQRTTTAARHMRHTIPQPFLATVMTLVALAIPAAASSQTRTNDDAFAPHAWHFELAAQAAIEAWNYNISHEE